MLEREHGIAETFQRAILTPPEDISSLEVSYLYQPASASANVGGDFYDVYALDDGDVALVIGDVAGKGVQAARLTVMIREGIRAYASEDPDPASVLGRLNSLMYRFTRSDMFATGVFCVLDSATGALRFCNAAHPAPVVLAEDSVRSLDAQSGLLGAFPDTRFVTADDILRPGEVLCLFTDGATEAHGESGLLGDEGVRATLDHLRGTPVKGLPQALLDRVMAYSCGNLRDDIAIVCVARTTAGNST
jgi:serine phosphatase RsbU (regulator of sigma subunit)